MVQRKPRNRSITLMMSANTFVQLAPPPPEPFWLCGAARTSRPGAKVELRRKHLTPQEPCINTASPPPIRRWPVSGTIRFHCRTGQTAAPERRNGTAPVSAPPGSALRFAHHAAEFGAKPVGAAGRRTRDAWTVPAIRLPSSI